MRKIIVACIVAAAVSLPIFAAEKMKIAIMDFRGQDLGRAEAVRITKMIRDEMINMGFFAVMDRSIINKTLNEQGIHMTGCTEVECMARVGKLLGVRKILTGTVKRAGDNIVLTCKVVDVPRGATDSIEREQTRGKEEIFNVVERLCDKLTLVISGSLLKTKVNPQKNK